MQISKKLTQAIQRINKIYAILNPLSTEIDQRDYVSDKSIPNLSEKQIEQYKKSLEEDSKIFTELGSTENLSREDQVAVQTKINEAEILIKKCAEIYSVLYFTTEVSHYVTEVEEISRDLTKTPVLDMGREMGLRVLINDKNLAKIRFNQSIYKHFDSAVSQYWQSYNKRKEIAPKPVHRESPELPPEERNSKQKLSRKKPLQKSVVVAPSNEKPAPLKEFNLDEMVKYIDAKPKKTKPKKSENKITNHPIKNNLPEVSPAPLDDGQVRFEEINVDVEKLYNKLRMCVESLRQQNYTHSDSIVPESFATFELEIKNYSDQLNECLAKNNNTNLSADSNAMYESVLKKLDDCRSFLNDGDTYRIAIEDALKLMARISTFVSGVEGFIAGRIENLRLDIEEQNAIQGLIEKTLDKVSFNSAFHNGFLHAVENFKQAKQKMQSFSRVKEVFYVPFDSNNTSVENVAAEREEPKKHLGKKTTHSRLVEKLANKIHKNPSEQISKASPDLPIKGVDELLQEIEGKATREDGKKIEKNKKKKQAKKNREINKSQGQDQLSQFETVYFLTQSENDNKAINEVKVNEVEPAQSSQHLNNLNDIEKTSAELESSQSGIDEDLEILTRKPKKMSSRNKKKALLEQNIQTVQTRDNLSDSLETENWQVPWEEQNNTETERLEIKTALAPSQQETNSQQTTTPIKKSTYAELFNKSGILTHPNPDQFLSVDKSERLGLSEQATESVETQNSVVSLVTDAPLNPQAVVESIIDEDTVLLTPEVSYYRAQIRNLISNTYDEVLMPIKEGLPFYTRTKIPSPSELPDPVSSGVHYDFLIMKTQSGAFKELYAPIAVGFQIMTTFQSNFFSSTRSQKGISSELEQTQALENRYATKNF